MVPKNIIVCKNCNSENASYELICKNCKSYLRERIVNIDLWNIFSLIIESPSTAFNKIIQAEHKNFIVFLAFIIGLKVLINVMFVSIATINNEKAYYNFFLNYLILFFVIVLSVFVYSFLLKFINNKSNLKTRLKDTVAIIIYSMLPYIIGAVLLFPLELILFGDSVFSVNPSPFLLKPTFAYILLGFEAVLVLWAMFLSVNAFIVQSNNIKYGVAAGIGFHLLLFMEIYLSSIILFTI